MSKNIKIIAETAWHHEGDFDFMKNLVSKICKTKTDIVKLHLTLDIDEYMHSSHPLYNNSKNWMLSKDQWRIILNIIKDSGKELMLLYNDRKAAEYGSQFNPDIIEIHSACLNDYHLLNKVNTHVGSHTKIAIGVGGSTIYEVESAIKFLHNDNIILMFGFQNYPTKYEDINFDKVRKIMKLFSNYDFGYADHCAWNEPNNLLITLLGAAQGMNYIEKHVTTEFGKERCDWNSAISIDMLNELVNKIEIVNKCNGNGLLELNEAEQKYSQFGISKKAPILCCDVESGDVIEPQKLIFQRTGEYSDLSQLDAINSFGKWFSKALKSGTILLKKYIKSV
jgi:N,N'-diacetyllegionaminate synthase